MKFVLFWVKLDVINTRIWSENAFRMMKRKQLFVMRPWQQWPANLKMLTIWINSLSILID